MKKFLLLLLLSNSSLIYSNLNVSLIVTHTISCYDSNDGQLTAIVNGGSGTYSFSLDGVSISSSGVFSNLSPGTYQVTVTDTITNETANSNLSSLTYPSPIACTGFENVLENFGYVTVTAIGGTPPYQYSMNGITFQNSSSFTFFNIGTYTILIKDSYGCLCTYTFTNTTLSTSTFDNFHFTSNSNLFSFSNGTKIENLFVYNILGEKILSKNINESSSQIDFSTLTKGIYFVKLSSGNEEKTIKISKN